ncbi:MAG: hypothetical protein ACTH1D_06775 [Mycobacteriaceae bacterium]|uniref:Uncharacterized protein n=1 Tax=Corynebacterium variabile (strain DSM 44702 / CIP 107183 / JCM 12073 / NCIMB 30131) TaxID=858619 RepID=G0HF25_CORVD|nr:hypothetical protein [Corynebacterium variabile]AEK37477.1 hypothetical protein CVAR_2127 [Corynebacterium variabile DSM 44702]
MASLDKELAAAEAAKKRAADRVKAARKRERDRVRRDDERRRNRVWKAVAKSIKDTPDLTLGDLGLSESSTLADLLVALDELAELASSSGSSTPSSTAPAPAPAGVDQTAFGSPAPAGDGEVI